MIYKIELFFFHYFVHLALKFKILRASELFNCAHLIYYTSMIERFVELLNQVIQYRKAIKTKHIVSDITKIR